MIIKGKSWKFGDNIDTDVIIPARYLNLTEPSELVKYLFEPLRENFVSKVKRGDLLIAGENFGCGSSREHAPIAIKASGISCVIAKSFARIFYRNSFNIGLPLIICPDIVEEIEEGDEIEVDLKRGEIFNRTKEKEYSFPPFEKLMMNLIEHNGLIPYLLSGKFSI
ncbi:MAG: 3-isopropylmalate dehydratase small subunit [candidate division WOR-3 bacterium]|nr:3-isopropylmalate dehydratase small subunit [candidate division WOR-3 bacterium]